MWFSRYVLGGSIIFHMKLNIYFLISVMMGREGVQEENVYYSPLIFLFNLKELKLFFKL